MKNVLSVLLACLALFLISSCQKSEPQTANETFSGKWRYEKASYFDKINGGNHKVLDEYDETEINLLEDGTLTINNLDKKQFFDGNWTLIETIEGVPVIIPLEDFMIISTIDIPKYSIHLELRDTTTNIISEQVWTDITIRKKKIGFNYRPLGRTYRFRLTNMD